MPYFFDLVTNQTSKKGYLLELIKRCQKFMKRIFHVNVIWFLTSEKEFKYALFTKSPRKFVARDFSSTSIKLKRGILPPLTKKVFNLKTTCHIKPKFFFWTKLLENLLLTKYFVSGAAVLIVLLICSFLCRMIVATGVLARVRLLFWNNQLREMYCDSFS